MPQYSVLLVDDDVKLVRLLQSYFEKDGFLIYTAHDGLDALQIVRQRKPNIVVLDLMLPGLDGLEVCRKIRKDNDVPILMLTAKDEEADRLVGLEIGADDFVTKPFSPKEVVARVKAILRREHKQVVQYQPIQVGAITIDLERHQVLNNQNQVQLTPTEFKILELLAGNIGKVFSRAQIAEQAQGYTFDGYERTVDAHIKNLRRKIGDQSKDSGYIQTVYGIGYKLEGVNHE